MKKIYILIFISAYMSNQCIVLAQDIVNPYKDYSQIPYPSTFQGGNTTLNFNFLHPMVFGDISSYKLPNNPIRPLLKSSTCVRDEDVLGSITGITHTLAPRSQLNTSNEDELEKCISKLEQENKKLKSQKP